MKSHTPSGKAKADDPKSAPPDPHSTAPKGASSPPHESGQDPEIVEERRDDKLSTEERRRLMTFVHNVNSHTDEAFDETVRRIPKPGAWLLAFAVLFLLVALGAWFFLWKLDTSASVISETANLDERFDEHAKKMKGYLDAQARQIAQGREKDREILSRIEGSNDEHFAIQKAQAEATKAISENVLAIRSDASKISSLENAVNGLRQDVQGARADLGGLRGDANTSAALARTTTSNLVAELSSLKERLDKAAVSPSPSIEEASKPDDAPPPLPLSPNTESGRIVSPAPPAPPSASPTLVPAFGEGGTASGTMRDQMEWRGERLAPGVESRHYSARDFAQGKVRVTARGNTIVKNHISTFGWRRSVDRQFPLVFEDAEEVSFVSDQEIVIWERKR